jgi:SAM-dependent methyltransferase
MWAYERVIEIPIINGFVEEHRGKRILEVGNVLSHYLPVEHDVLDKYEKGRDIINQDVVDFKPSLKYDLIVSISTLEHVGWDEFPKNPMKILHALDNLKRCLATGGKMVITFPLGYNSEMDRLLKRGELNFNEQYYLKRITIDNRWVETALEDVINTKYDEPFLFANALVIGIFNS